MCLERALRNGGLRGDQVDYVNAHATSTPVSEGGGPCRSAPRYAGLG